MAKSPATVYVCQNCGHQTRKWLGKCPDCGEWNSFVEERARVAPKKEGAASRGGFQLREVKPVAYREIESQDDARVSSGIEEFDRVLGGGVVPGSLVLIGGDPGIGKCLVGSTRLIDPSTGDWLPITEWRQDSRPLLSLDTDKHQLNPQKASAFHDQGEHKIVEVTTKLGRSLHCTPNHPVLTPEGWAAAGDLRPGAYVATPRALPYFGRDALPEHQVKLIAYLLSDGSAQSQISVTNAITEVATDLEDVARNFGVGLRVYDKPNNTARQFRFVQPPAVRVQARQKVSAALNRAQLAAGLNRAEWARAASVSYGMLRCWQLGKGVPGESALERLAAAIEVPAEEFSPALRAQAEMKTSIARFSEAVGLRYVKARSKAIPACVFRLPRPQLALFLKVLFSCDGSVYVTKNNQAGVSYSTISKRLAQDVQHLLLRFGFVAKLREKRSKVNGRIYHAYELQILGVSEVKRFLSEVGIWGRDKAKAKLASMPDPSRPSTHFDIIPTGTKFWEQLRELASGESFKDISERTGVWLRNRRHDRPLCRRTVAGLADAFSSGYLRALAYGDIYWDQVKSVKPAGAERVYDLTVPVHGNFIADDFVVHNSTLLAQAADKLSGQGMSVLYVSGEESERQIKMRGERLGLEAENLFLLPETNLENIFGEIERMRPDVVIVDSIQTVFSSGIESAPGSVSQVREVAGQFLLLAKNRTIPVFLIGHVTKEGSIAGPKALEHIVDTVLYFEGERHHNHRIVRATKNRFGAANEVGVFEMTGTGLVAVANPSEMFLQERPEGVAGSVVTACMEGTRPMLVEIQALVSGSKYGAGRRRGGGEDDGQANRRGEEFGGRGRRVAQGIDYNRLSLLIAMLEKRVGFPRLSDDVFVNVAGGLEIDEPASDLGVVAAVVSSIREKPIEKEVTVFGEVGLTGEVRGAMHAEARAREAQTLGFKKIVMPASNKPGLERLLGVRVVGVRSVEEALGELF